jgi:hypothetical protein
LFNLIYLYYPVCVRSEVLTLVTMMITAICYFEGRGRASIRNVGELMQATSSDIAKDSHSRTIHELLEELRRPKETSVRIACLWT